MSIADKQTFDQLFGLSAAFRVGAVYDPGVSGMDNSIRVRLMCEAHVAGGAGIEFKDKEGAVYLAVPFAYQEQASVFAKKVERNYQGLQVLTF